MEAMEAMAGLEARFGRPQWGELAGKVMAEYIYIDSEGSLPELQSKTVILEGGRPSSVDALPSVELATARGEVYLRPRSIYADPLRGGDHVLVLCDCHVPPQLGAGEAHPQPHEANMRAACAEAMAAAEAAAPAFTFEQEYAVLDPFTGLPPGVFPVGVPGAGAGAGACGFAPGSFGAGSYHSGCESGSAWGSPCGGLGGGPLSASLGGAPHCGSAGGAHLLLAGHAQPQHPRGSPAARRARQLSELHMRACIRAGLRYAGASHGDRLWSYRIGPCGGVDIGDQVCVSRFLLARISEELDVEVSFATASAPKQQLPGGFPAQAWPQPPPPPAAEPPGCSVEFSTAATRPPAPDAIGETQRMLSRLQAAHASHAAGFCRGAAAAAAPLTVAVGDRRASVVIPSSTLAARGGPFVDRRAGGACDPYLVASLLACGALGLPLPAAAARAVAARSAAAPFAAAAAPSATAASAQHPQLAPAAAVAAAAELLLSQQRAGQASGAPFGGLYAALFAAGRAAAAAGAAPQGSLSAGCGCGGRVDGDDDCCCCSGDGSEDEEEEGSEDMLISEIRRMDRAARRCGKACGGARGAGAGAGEDDYDDYDDEDEEDDSASSAAPSAASSPGCEGALAAACGDAEMLCA